MTALTNPDSVLPAALAQCLRDGREKLLLLRTSRKQQADAARQAALAAANLSWARLLAAADSSLPDALLPYLERDQPDGFRMDTDQVALAANVPGLSPILAAFRYYGGRWLRWSFLGDIRKARIDFDSLYAVVVWETRDTASEDELLYEGNLPLALALAEEAEHERQRLPADPFDQTDTPRE